MTASSKTIIKSYFETSDKPTQAQFADFIDSYIDTSAAGTVGLNVLGAITSASAQSAMGIDFSNVNITGGNLSNVTASAAVINVSTIVSPIVLAGTLTNTTLNSPAVSGGTAIRQIITSATVNGSTLNNAPQVFTSYSHAGVGLGTANNFFPLSGSGYNPNVTSTAQYGGVLAVGGTIRGFATFLNAAASGGTRTFSVYKNGAATGVTLTYGSAEANAKSVTGSANFVAGDYLEILSSVQGTPVNNGGGSFSVFTTINNS